MPRTAIITNITRASTMMIPPRTTSAMLPEMKPRNIRNAPTMAMRAMRYCMMFPEMKSDPAEVTPPTIGLMI
jgi:hypothetical protein